MAPVARLDATIALGSAATAAAPAAGPAAATAAAPTAGPTGAAISIRWVGRFTFPEDGRYIFSLSANGPVRLWIDGAQIVDGWDGHGAKAYIVPQWLASGPHVIRLDYRSGSTPGATPGVTPRVTPVVTLGWPVAPDARAGPVTL